MAMNGDWSAQGAAGRVVLDGKALGLTVHAGRETWKTAAGRPDEIAIRSAGETSAMPLAAAAQKKISPCRSGTAVGFRADLSGFPQCDLALTLVLLLDLSHPELTVRVTAREGEASIRHLRWPGPMESPAARSDQTTALPIKQGALLAGNWNQTFEFAHNINGGGAMYMPWWGQYRPGGGCLAVVETAADASVVVDHPAGGPTDVGVQWDPSLGRFSHARSIRYVFADRCDFVTLAKTYRSYVESQGRFVSLVEKIARTPALESLIGAPAIHTGICSHIQPESRYYKPDDPAKNHRCVRFGAGGRAAEAQSSGPPARVRPPGRMGASRVRQPASGHPAALPRSRRVGRLPRTGRDLP